MNEWLLSLTGIIFISYALQIILPDGKTKKTVVFVFSIIAAAVIISPIAKLKTADYAFTSEIEMPEADEAYVEFTNNCRVDYCNTLARIRLLQKGIQIKNAQFILEEKQGKLIVEQIKINKSEIVIKSGAVNINIEQVIKDELCALFDIVPEQVIVYE